MKESDTLKHQPTVWPVPYIYHITRAVAAMDSCFCLIIASSAWHNRQAEIGLKALCSLPFTAEAGTEHHFKRQLHTKRVGAVGWEPHGSSIATCAEKVDQARADRCVNKFKVKRQ